VLKLLGDLEEEGEVQGVVGDGVGTTHIPLETACGCESRFISLCWLAITL
jgi:hypothetical protein